MRTKKPTQAVEPREVDRFLAGLAATDAFMEAWPDTRSAWSKLFGSPRFAWQTGWMAIDRRQHVFVHLTGCPPGLIREAQARLGAVYTVTRAEMGVLDKRSHHPFMVVLISGRRS